MGNIHMTKIYQDNMYSVYCIYIYIYLFIYLFIYCIYLYLESRMDNFFGPLWVLPVTDVFLFNCVFWFLIVKGCSNPNP